MADDVTEPPPPLRWTEAEAGPTGSALLLSRKGGHGEPGKRPRRLRRMPTTNATSLEAQETSEHEYRLHEPYPPRPEFSLPPITLEEHVFRHSGWAAHRRRVFAAMIAAGTGRSALHRFANCGSGAVIERSRDGDYRVRANYCRSRWCKPCAAARAAALADAIRLRLSGRTFRFLTLTLRSSATPLSDQIDRLTRSFRELRRQKLWRETVIGSIAVIELTRSNGCWHPHLHVLMTGLYVDQKALAERWHAITGDSYIVWIKQVSNPAETVGYVAAYASKGIDASVEADHDALTEAIRSLKGRRLVITTGEFYGVEKQEEPKEREPEINQEYQPYWQPVGTLTALVHRARHGSAEALEILNKLRFPWTTYGAAWP